MSLHIQQSPNVDGSVRFCLASNWSSYNLTKSKSETNVSEISGIGRIDSDNITAQDQLKITRLDKSSNFSREPTKRLSVANRGTSILEPEMDNSTSEVFSVSDPSSPSKTGAPSIVLPAEFIHCPRDHLVVLLARILQSLVDMNDSMTESKEIHTQKLTRFHSRAPPNISIEHYLGRLAQYSYLENAILLTAVYYIDLLSLSYPVFSLNSLTVHRFLLTATTIAAKGLCDSFCSNTHYAKVGGIHVSELNILEVEFLNKVNWRIVPRDFNHETVCIRSASPVSEIRLSVSATNDVLDMYYYRTIMLVGRIDDVAVNYCLAGRSSSETGSLKRTGNEMDWSSCSLSSKRNR
ncbi:BA75_04375T0 [Komagataella pastoris]|uniref:BA75_04375T0 n=1 Tax=Komagataella pastoris TaxID=4922 RepID=A0A1B2JIV6_PICPA|nr:BA75_04375T0 [Komagataella pastoris]